VSNNNLLEKILIAGEGGLKYVSQRLDDGRPPMELTTYDRNVNGMRLLYCNTTEGGKAAMIVDGLDRVFTFASQKESSPAVFSEGIGNWKSKLNDVVHKDVIKRILG
jgi:hypothetical protein